MKRKLSILLLVFTLLALSLSVANAQSTLLIWTTGSEDEALVLQAVGDAYGAANGVTVTVEAVSWDDAHARMLAAATSGTGPDIITGGLSWGIEFGSLGGMVNLSEAYPDMVTSISEQSNAGIWSSIVPISGEVYAVPYDLTIYLMYYRSDILETLGLAVPATWDDLTAAIPAIQEANGGEGGFAMQWGNTQWLQYHNYLYQAGGTWYDAECTEATLNSEEGVAALEFFASLYSDYGVPTDGWPDLEGGLNSGLYPLGTTGNWVAGGLERTYPDLAGKWSAAVLPAGPAGNSTAFIGGRVMGIMSFSQNVDAAAGLIEFLWTDEAVEGIVAAAAERGLLWIPPRAEFIGSPIVSDEVNAAIQAQLDQAVGPPSCSGWEQVSNEVQRLIETVIFEGADAQEALDEAADAMNDLLE